MVMMPRFPATRLGKLMRANTVEKILELCEEFVPGEVRPQLTVVLQKVASEGS